MTLEDGSQRCCYRNSGSTLVLQLLGDHTNFYTSVRHSLNETPAFHGKCA